MSSPLAVFGPCMYPSGCEDLWCDGVCYGVLMSRVEREHAYHTPCKWSIATCGVVDMPTDEEHAAAVAAEAARYHAAECFQHMLSVAAEPVFDGWMDGLVKAYTTKLAECGGKHEAAVARMREMDATKQMAALIGAVVKHGLPKGDGVPVRSAEDKWALSHVWFGEWYGWHCFDDGHAARVGVLLHEVIFKA